MFWNHLRSVSNSLSTSKKSSRENSAIVELTSAENSTLLLVSKPSSSVSPKCLPEARRSTGRSLMKSNTRPRSTSRNLEARTAASEAGTGPTLSFRNLAARASSSTKDGLQERNIADFTSSCSTSSRSSEDPAYTPGDSGANCLFVLTFWMKRLASTTFLISVVVGVCCACASAGVSCWTDAITACTAAAAAVASSPGIEDRMACTVGPFALRYLGEAPPRPWPGSVSDLCARFPAPAVPGGPFPRAGDCGA
mmetsp:Transcript_78107/g.228941  ORF Transcript_78107/g.228941 Transcript_78107/m.228941 type:complete len:252 (+) Transcript_78107:2609-3364(+)